MDRVFEVIKQPLNVPVLVVQHMPPKFPAQLAKRLGKLCPALNFSEGSQGEVIKAGSVYLAPGGCHMSLYSNISTKLPTLKLEDTPYVNAVRPAADVLFKAVAKCYEDKHVLAVTLTGMGCDGREGVRALKTSCRCISLTQTLSSCVVTSMPKSVQEAGLSDQELDPGDIGRYIFWQGR